MKQILVSILTILIIFTSCSKDIEEYNKPAIYWYEKMIEAISESDLEKADSYYTSLQSEHIASPLLPEATIIMALAHMYNEEYLLAEHFLDEYMLRYASDFSDKEEADYLKIKAKYLSLPNPRRDQKLIDEAIKESKKFLAKYPNSIHYHMVSSMLTRLYLAKAVLNETIASLYKRIDKPKAAKYYESKIKQEWIKWDEIEKDNTFWFRKMFEGDGSSSWYDFLIPDTKSVVSRNSNKEDINETK